MQRNKYTRKYIRKMVPKYKNKIQYINVILYYYNQIIIYENITKSRVKNRKTKWHNYFNDRTAKQNRRNTLKSMGLKKPFPSNSLMTQTCQLRKESSPWLVMEQKIKNTSIIIERRIIYMSICQSEYWHTTMHQSKMYQLTLPHDWPEIKTRLHNLEMVSKLSNC